MAFVIDCAILHHTWSQLRNFTIFHTSLSSFVSLVDRFLFFAIVAEFLIYDSVVLSFFPVLPRYQRSRTCCNRWPRWQSPGTLCIRSFPNDAFFFLVSR